MSLEFQSHKREGKYVGNAAVSVFTLRGTLRMSKVKEINNFKATYNCYGRIVKNEPTEPQYQFFQWFSWFQSGSILHIKFVCREK